MSETSGTADLAPVLSSKVESAGVEERVNLNPYMPTEARLKNHEVPIKAEFLKEIFADPTPIDTHNTRPEEDNPTPKKIGKYTKAARRERKEKKIQNLFQGKGFCHATSMGEECPYKDCRFSHDIESYLKEKPVDISDQCWVFEQQGYCNFGFRCRFANTHIKDGKLIQDEEKKAKFEANGGDPVVNTISKDIQLGLRKKKIPFTKTRKSLKENASGNLGHLQKIPENPTDGIVLPERGVKKTVDWENKLILAPLTTIGNLPYRRICKQYGADITVGEMALATQLLAGSPTEWALVKRHKSEDVFGVQLAGSHPDSMTACAELLNSTTDIDFIDINCGCPIDVVCNKGAGSSLLTRKARLENSYGVQDKNPVAHNLVPLVKEWGVSAVTLHGRSKEQRYTKAADREYLKKCAELSPVPFICNGDTYSWQDAVKYRDDNPSKSIMIARGAIIKPWIFKEIKEQKDFDISGSERLDMIKEFVNYGFEHWGSDQKGISNIRNFLLNWMSFLCRYVPVGIVEHLPVQINHRPPVFVGRDDKETLLSSSYVKDWIEISEMFLGPCGKEFSFVPKHRANSYPQHRS